MKIIYYLISCLLVGLAVGCEQSIYVKPTDVSDKLNIYAINQANRLAEVYIFRQDNLSGYLEQDAKLSFIEDAKVEIQDLTDGAKDSLILKGKWVKGVADYYGNIKDSIWVMYYKAQTTAKVGHTYQLNVTYKDNTITAQSTVPTKMTIDKVDSLNEISTADLKKTQVSITHTDNISEVYYRANLRYQFRYPMLDSAGNLLNISTKTTTNRTSLTLSEIGKVWKDNVSYQVQNYFQTAKDTVKAKVYLHIYDKAAGDYLVSSKSQKSNIDNPFAEPVFLKSNIEGKKASGVFGFYITSDTTYLNLWGYP